MRLALALRTSARVSSRSFSSTPMSAVNKAAHPFDKARLDALLNRRFFYAPAFEIYGGIAGLYDYGPPGSALQANIIAEWRKHFVIEEGMLELDTTVITPAPVFETSGHVARFADWMVKDSQTGDVLRADHLVKAVLEARLAGDRDARGRAQKEDDKDAKKKKKKVKSVAVELPDAVVADYERILAQLDNYSGPQLGELCRTHNIKNPDTDNDVGEPQQFNLMFTSSIGPTGQHPAYLRPETAQGHFLNFSRLLDFNNGRVPFASAQIGRSFRNEISPRAGLLRVREFTMAEIEHFVDPADKRHPRFPSVAHLSLALLPRAVQESGSAHTQPTALGPAVESGLIANETLAYFLARIALFLTAVGIDPARLRFRQHMAHEMAHYAADCWDAEIEGAAGGWTECVGCADRAAYDLTVHAARTGHPLVVRVPLKEPVVTEVEAAEWNKRALGRTFGRETAAVQRAVEEMDEARLVRLKGELAQGAAALVVDGKEVRLTPELLTIERKTVKQSIREFTPNVIEPSFGLGRILYHILEHSFWSREQDVERGVLSLPPAVAPTKVLIVPLSARDEFAPLVQEVSARLRQAGVFARVDDSNTSIGRRYARNDELGTPYGVTLDFASVKNSTMTLRERDTTEQLIGPIDDVLAAVTELVQGRIDWAEAARRLPRYDGVQAVD